MKSPSWNLACAFLMTWAISSAGVSQVSDNTPYSQSQNSQSQNFQPQNNVYPENLPPPGDRQLPASSEYLGMPAAAPIVVDLRIIGNQQVRKDKIEGRCKTRRGREFDAEQLKTDVRNLMACGLFRDVRPRTQHVPDGVVVTIEVVERPMITEIKFIGNRGLSDKRLLREAGIKVKEPLNHYAVEEARRKVEEFYRSRGYVNAQVSILEGKGPNDRRVVLEISEGNLVRIEKVDFVGNTIADDRRLKTQIDSKPGILWYFMRGKLDVQKLDDDEDKLLAYYRSLGYFRARLGREVEVDPSGSWATLTFVIDEGPRYAVRNVSVSGNEVFSNNDLLGTLELQSGDFFNQAKMNRDVSSLRDVYGSQGYVFTEVKADPVFLEEPGQLDLVYRVEEGQQFRAGKINVEIGGEYPHTRDMVVLNRLSITPGEVLDIREVRASERRLKASQLFEDETTGGQPPRVAILPLDADDVGRIAKKPKPRTSRN